MIRLAREAIVQSFAGVGILLFFDQAKNIKAV
jgi:hypothetical protein